MGRRRKNIKLNSWQYIFAIVILICVSIYGYINQNNTPEISENTYNLADQNLVDNYNSNDQTLENNNNLDTKNVVDLSTIPEYVDKPYVEINNNTPYFTEEDLTKEAFEKYSELDVLGRNGVAIANICKEIMPAEDEERGEIGGIKPTGWVQKRYDDLIKDKYLYNRCHLIGWQLAGENANKNNLITGTRYLNTEGMLPFENEVAEYLDKNENNHVLYRVTPIFEGNNLLASGVEMEAFSVEDSGAGVKFNVYCYNVQPGIVIDYATGENHAQE